MLLILSKFHYYLLFTLFFCCSKPKLDPPPPRANCGEIVRLYSQNTTFEEGNPCGNNDDYSRRFSLIVANDITGNEKHFCVNISVFTDYSLGNTYCDSFTSEGW
jgi:hypothetical protein